MRRLLSILAILCTFAFIGRSAGYAVTDSKSFYFENDTVTAVSHSIQTVYDGIGRAVSTDCGGAGVTAWAYDVSGRTAAISGPGFSASLHYADGPGTPRYNGFLSSMTWRGPGDTDNRGVASIDYDNLGNPRLVTFADGSSTAYVYAPDGRKLRVIHRTAITPAGTPGSPSGVFVSDTTDYAGPVVRRNGSVERVLIDGGHATLDASGSATYHFHTLDHLGNMRAVVNDRGLVEQHTHYYPYGGIFADASSGQGIQPLRYNGKELDRVHGLDTYDYGFRQYYPMVPMWDRMDQLSESYTHISPYAYCGANPVCRTDLYGLLWDDESKEDVDKLLKNINKRIAKLDNKIDQTNQKIGNNANKGKSTNKLSEKVQDLQAQKDYLQQSIRDINLLADDTENTYRLNRVGNDQAHRVRQYNGKIIIDTSSDALSIHEITHIRQSLLNGGLSFVNGLLKNSGVFGGSNMEKYANLSNVEVEAYKAQFSMDNGSLPFYANNLGMINYTTVGNIMHNGMFAYPQIKEYSDYMIKISSIRP